MAGQVDGHVGRLRCRQIPQTSVAGRIAGDQPVTVRADRHVRDILSGKISHMRDIPLVAVQDKGACGTPAGGE